MEKMHCRQIAFASAIATCTLCNAANVVWNAFSSWGDGSDDYGRTGRTYFSVTARASQTLNNSPEVLMDCVARDGRMILTPGHFDEMNAASSDVLWMVMEAGSIAAYDTLMGSNAYFLSDELSPGGTHSDYSLDIIEGDTAYVAFVTQFSAPYADENSYIPDEHNYPIYGWVALSYSNGEVSLAGSAYDADGGPMIVGGGSASTPEPSGALLALAGGAALVLRRNRGRGFQQSKISAAWKRAGMGHCRMGTP